MTAVTLSPWDLLSEPLGAPPVIRSEKDGSLLGLVPAGTLPVRLNAADVGHG